LSKAVPISFIIVSTKAFLFLKAVDSSSAFMLNESKIDCSEVRSVILCYIFFYFLNIYI